MERIHKNTFQTLHFSWDASANDPRPWALHPPKWPGDKDDCRRQGFLTKRIQDLSLFRMAVLLTSPNISFTRHRFTNPFSVFCSLLALFCRTCLFFVLGFHKFRTRVLDDACPPVRSWNRDGQIASPKCPLLFDMHQAMTRIDNPPPLSLELQTNIEADTESSHWDW